MGPIAWQYGHVGEWNSTRLGRAEARTAVSKFDASSCATFEGSPEEDVAGVDAALGADDPPPQAAAVTAAARAHAHDTRLIEPTSPSPVQQRIKEMNARRAGRRADPSRAGGSSMMSG
jgi:hypothetical protein